MKIFEKSSTLTLSCLFVSACSAYPVNLSNNNPVGDVPVIAVKSPSHEFRYSISRTLKSEILDKAEHFYKTQSGTQKFKSRELYVTLFNSKDIDEVVREAGASSYTQEVVHTISEATGNKATGEFHPSEILSERRVPNFVLHFNANIDEDLSNFTSLAKEAGDTGTYEFSTLQAAATYQKALFLKAHLPSSVKYSSINGIYEPGTSTYEGNTSSANGGVQICPSTSGSAGFWYAATYTGSPLGINIINNGRNEHQWDYGEGSGVKVAVIDSGFQGASEAYMPAQYIAPVESTYNVPACQTSIAGYPNASDGGWHGREVSSLIFAANYNGGTLGTAFQASPLLIHSDYTWSNLVTAIDFACDNGAEVINFSTSGVGTTQAFSDVIQMAYNQGRVFVCIAGNSQADFPNRTEYPAAYSSWVLSVGSHKASGARSAFSNLANYKVWAPGEDVAVALPPGQNASYVQYASGTSFAAPLVAGVVASAQGHGRCSDLATAEARLWNTRSYYSADVPNAVDAINAVR